MPEFTPYQLPDGRIIGVEALKEIVYGTIPVEAMREKNEISHWAIGKIRTVYFSEYIHARDAKKKPHPNARKVKPLIVKDRLVTNTLPNWRPKPSHKGCTVLTLDEFCQLKRQERKANA